MQTYKTIFPIDIFQQKDTPFYFYDLELLERTLASLSEAASVNPKFKVHYAMKACAVCQVMDLVRNAGLGLDTVSGGEIRTALEFGFSPASIMFAGVGKTDAEIRLGLQSGIGMFNVESLEELAVINEIAGVMHTKASVALRINPDIDAHTHHFITTGVAENKFGIPHTWLDKAVDMAMHLPNVELLGLHFHIGSQITVDEPFKILAERINVIQAGLRRRGINIRSINVGGGLGVDYEAPDADPIPDFESYFRVFNDNLDTTEVESVHFELGRSVVAQCGSLISRVVFVKRGEKATYAILDAGMTELIRPALYEARHAIDNLTALSPRPAAEVHVVGPVCESTDDFGVYTLPEPRRGDIFAIRSAGAYGEAMSSHYNGRCLEEPVFRLPTVNR